MLHATRSKDTTRGGLTASNKHLLGAKGIATNGAIGRYERSSLSRQSYYLAEESRPGGFEGGCERRVSRKLTKGQSIKRIMKQCAIPTDSASQQTKCMQFCPNLTIYATNNTSSSKHGSETGDCAIIDHPEDARALALPAGKLKLNRPSPSRCAGRKERIHHSGKTAKLRHSTCVQRPALKLFRTML